MHLNGWAEIRVSDTCKGTGSGGRRGRLPPLPSDWGGKGGQRVRLQYEKNDVINIHISLNLRRMKKENDKFVIVTQ